MTEFEGRLYIGKAAEPVVAQVSLSNSNVVLSHSQGTTEEFPVNDISIEQGGHLDDRVKIKFADAGRLLVISGHEFLEHLEQRHPNLDVVIQSKLVKGKIKHSGVIRGSYVAVFLGIICGIGAIFYVTLDFWVGLAADQVPVSVEEQIGALVIPEKRLSQVLKKNTNKQDARKKKLARIKAIGAKLVKAVGDTPYKFQFDVEENKLVNAYALPGGYVFVLDGLIKAAKSDDEIAGIIGHEIGHVIHRDSLRRLLHSSGLGMCLAIVTGGTVSNDQIKVLIPTMKRLESLSYSRGQEAAADKVGVELALKAGYDPEAFSEFFLRLKDELGTDSSVAVLFSDHPMTQDRVNAIHKESEIQRKKLGLPTK